eukprot:306408_1
MFAFCRAVLISLLYINTKTEFITIEDLSVISTINNNKVSVLLTNDPFICNAIVEFNDTFWYTFLDTMSLNNTILYYNVMINSKKVDSGSVIIEEYIPTLYSYSITSNEITIDKTGDTSIEMQIWFDDEISDEVVHESTNLFSITGFTSMVPIIFVIFFALVLKNAYITLYFGIWVGSFIISGCSFRYAFELSLGTYILDSASNKDHQYVILFTVFLSGLVFLIRRSGGAKGFALVVSKLAKTGKKTLLASYLAGLLLFFDDYSNALIVGTTFQPLTDMFHISREKIAFIADASSAPVTSIVPLSSWIGFELQQIQQQLDIIKEHNDGIMPDGLTDNAFEFFIETISTRFYPIYMFIFQLIILSLSIDFGPMLISERICRIDKRTDGGNGSNTSNDDDELLNTGAEPTEDTPGRWWNMLVPILTLIILILAGMMNSGIENIELQSDPSVSITASNIFAYSDPFASLLYGTFGACMITIAFFMLQFKYKGCIVLPSIASCKNYLIKKEKHSKETPRNVSENVAKPLMKFGESIETCIRGISFMSPAVCVLILVWGIGTIMTDIGADRYITRIMSDDINPSILPTLVFVMAAFLSAATGTSWGTMTIMFPLIGSAAWKICEPLDDGIWLYTATLSQILSGSIFGDHASPLSDTTLISSVASGCDLFRHVYTQMPYAVWVAFFSIICGTIMVGQGISAAICISVGILSLSICTFLIGAPPIGKSGRYDVFTEIYLLFLNKCKCKCWKRKQKIEVENPEEHKLILLKRKTIEFVKSEKKEDVDYLMKFLTVTRLNVLFGIGVDIDNDISIEEYNEVKIIPNIIEEDEIESGHNFDDDLL